MLEVHVMLHQRGKGTARKSSRLLARMHPILAGTRRSAREGNRFLRSILYVNALPCGSCPIWILVAKSKTMLVVNLLVNRLNVRTQILGREPLVRTFSPNCLG